MTKYVDRADAIAADEIYEFLNREGLDHKIIEDEYGVWRWETDPTMEMLYDAGMIKLNTLAAKIPNFRNDPRIRDLYRQIGISLHGYWETFHWEVNNEHADEYEGD